MTAREQLDKCLDIKKQIRHEYNLSNGTSTPVGPNTKLLMTEVTTLIALLPAHLDSLKKMLETDMKNMSSHSNYINAFTYGSFGRALDVLDSLLPTNGIKKIFISHSSKDKVIVDAFVTMLCVGAGFKTDDIFCTSIDGMQITNGEDIRKHIQDNVNYADFVILLISKNYKKSEICLNEMGAVWAIDKKVKPYVFPNMKESEVGWLLNAKAAEKINDMTALASLYDELTNFYKKPQNAKLWIAQANKFCNTFAK